MPIAETDARVNDVLALVPITRVSDVSPLDPLGLPTYSAVTPLAEDLTSHMGKGRDAISARVSAVMEAVERVSAETPAPGGERRATYDELARELEPGVIDPTTCTLPSDSAFRPDRAFTWVPSYDLVTDAPVWMASDLVVSPPRDGVLHEVDTNGLASGNTRLEATVHGLCEVIERDAWSQLEFELEFGGATTSPPPHRGIDLDTLDDEATAWVDRIQGCGLSLVLLDLTNDVDVATVLALLVDPHYSTPRGVQQVQFLGLGTHPSAPAAVFRAITESVQSRLASIQGARDSYNLLAPSTRRHTRARRIAQREPDVVVPLGDVTSATHDDLLDDLRFLVDRVAHAGLDHVVVTDLTRPALGIPVVRVRVPGLSQYVVNRRRVDWRCLRHLL